MNPRSSLSVHVYSVYGSIPLGILLVHLSCLSPAAGFLLSADDRNTSVELNVYRRLLHNVVGQDDVLRIECDDVAELGEDVVAACYTLASTMRKTATLLTSSEKVERDDIVSGRLVQSSITNSDVHEPTAGFVVWIIFNSDTAADLEEAGDFFAVELSACQLFVAMCLRVVSTNLADTRAETFEDAPKIFSVQLHFDHAVAEWERRQDLAAGDRSYIDRCTNTTSIDQSEVGRIAGVQSI